MATAQWIQEAEEQARKYSEAIKNNNQYLIDQLNAAKTNSMEQLQKQQENALYNLNTNKSTINQNAEDAAKQANINRLLALRDNQYAMNRAGLGTSGIVGSQVNSINNNYGTNLSSILNEKNNNLNDLIKQKQDLNTTYDTNRLNLENEYASNLANLRADIDAKALNQYNSIYNNYLAMKQQEYENEQAEKAAAEAIRQYNENLAFQKAKAAQDQANWEKEYALAKRKANSSSGNSYTLTNGNNNSGGLNNNQNKTSNGLDNTRVLNKPDYSVVLSTNSASKWWNDLVYNSENWTEESLYNTIKTGKNQGYLTNADADKILKSFGY